MEGSKGHCVYQLGAPTQPIPGISNSQRMRSSRGDGFRNPRYSLGHYFPNPTHIFTLSIFKRIDAVYDVMTVRDGMRVQTHDIFTCSSPDSQIETCRYDPLVVIHNPNF